MIRRNNKWLVLLVTSALAAAYGFAPGVGAQVKEQGGREARKNAEKREKQPAGKKGERMMMCPMMESLDGLALHADSPALLLARAEELKLTKDQRQRLEQAVESARRQARQVLTAEQRKELEDAPEGPLTMMDLCMLRMKEMKGKPKGKEMMCPMCERMMKMREQKAGKPRPEKKKQE